MEEWRDGRMEEWDRRLAGPQASTHPSFEHSILPFSLSPHTHYSNIPFLHSILFVHLAQKSSLKPN
jgi:hypothetical protein